MEAGAAFCNSGLDHLTPSLSGNKIKHFTKLGGSHTGSLKFGKQCKNKSGLATGCVTLGSGSVAELEKQLEAEMKQEEEEEWQRMGNLRGNCKESKGMADLLECLETEAIMGDDEGKEPTDYNRRAQIFYKSSRLFQALKEQSTSSSSNQS